MVRKTIHMSLVFLLALTGAVPGIAALEEPCACCGPRAADIRYLSDGPAGPCPCRMDQDSAQKAIPAAYGPAPALERPVSGPLVMEDINPAARPFLSPIAGNPVSGRMRASPLALLDATRLII